ncbi:Topoisomerase II-associated protein PAT1 [Penicillium bovifimosum]|uniref:Topoisomerase II-associated protein PAT1 n=1 Tax=Penicillium bovifimosum TaxID=126998 RepID=A0A9W9GJB4_9EURO|nr:Topoisomerase II-associated protein PAT1 [Penicillium bovifimosum]KAJ5121330.1 Topoisomerase II-associated protein PAT1 [Penicillium bovifimosum]
MSFFGFETKLPRDRDGSGSKGFFETSDPFADIARAHALEDDDVIDFEDTYDGLGDQLPDDQDEFNDDTFGAGGADTSVGRDFDFFGKTAQVSDVIGEEQVRYSLQNPNSARVAPQPAAPAVQPAASKTKRSGYEKYSDPGYIPDLQAKSSVWGVSQKKPEPVAAAPAASTASRKMMSLEEVEAQMRQQGHNTSTPAAEAFMRSMVDSQYPQPQHLQTLPDGFPPVPPEFLHAQIKQGHLPPGMPHPPPGMPELYGGPGPMPPGVPLHMMQNANLPPQSMPPAGPRHVGPPQAQRPQQPQLPHLPQQQQVPLPNRTSANGIPVITNPQQLRDLTEEQRNAYLVEDAKRAKRNHKIFLLSRGNGLMTPQDKNFITRIQLQQLVAAAGNVADSDPEAVLAEDFYYQVYSQIRGAPRQHPPPTPGPLRPDLSVSDGQQARADNHMQRMQQQVQRAVEAAKAKPKNKQLIIEGSLGKISFSNAKAPKPMLNIKRPDSSEGPKPKKQSDLSLSDRKSILTNLEGVYSSLMAMEDMERTMPPPPEEGDAEAIQVHMEWRQKLHSLNQKLWRSLKVMEPIVPNSTTPHPFIAFLSYPKGKKAIPRIFRHIDQEQRVTILTMIVVHLDSLDVVRLAQPVPGEAQPSLGVREAIDLFSLAVMPCLLGYVNEAPFNIIIGLLGLVINQTHVQTVARTKVGLGILTMLLSRAEIVKEAGQASEHDWQQWVQKFNILFDTLELGLNDIFPGTISSGDDMYVWQFLAAVGIGASPEQQQRLVIAVKDRVMETVSYSKTLPADMGSQRLSNVNLFMRAIGLDVELLG